jgi:zinc transport system substrate-binding protein
MIKKVTVLLLSLIFIFSFAACNNKQSNTSETTQNNVSIDKLNVMVSFNPLKEFTDAIGKDKVYIQNLVPEGMEPHDFEPKARDLENINKGKVFIINGLGMEPWTEKVLGTIENKDLVVVEASKGCNVIENTEADEIDEHGQYDPHTWLSLKEAKIQSLNIKEALVKADPSNKDFYEKNYIEFAAQLDGLYSEYKTKFDGIKNKQFVTGHAAFSYLSRDFGLEQRSIEDVFAEGEPSPKTMTELIDYCKKNNVKTIFAEEMASPKVSETLAKEIGAKVEKIYSIESKEDGKNYIQSMRDNLEKIYSSLK